MASLAAMPTELSQAIFHYLPPEDKDSLSLVSHRVREVAAPILEEHQALKQEYGMRKCATFDPDSTTVTTLLLEILRQPYLAFYIKKLTIDGWYHHWIEALNHCHQSFDDDRILRQQAQVFFSPRILDIFDDNMRDGDESSCLVLLLCLLPNLSTFSVIDEGSASFCAFEMLKHTLTHNRDRGLLAHLANVYFLSSRRHLDEAEERFDRSLDTIDEISLLPSVKNIKVKEFSHADQLHRPFGKEVRRPSQVTELGFLRSRIGAKALFGFLRGFPLLESFTYTSGRLSRFRKARRITDDIYWICHSLQLHANKTL